MMNRPIIRKFKKKKLQRLNRGRKRLVNILSTEDFKVHFHNPIRIHKFKYMVVGTRK